VELGRGRIGHVQAAARAYRYLLLHLRAPDAALLARELMVEPVVRARPTLAHCYPPARPCVARQQSAALACASWQLHGLSRSIMQPCR